MSIFNDIAKLKTWLLEAEAAMEKAIETGDVTGLKQVVNDLRDLGFVHDDVVLPYIVSVYGHEGGLTFVKNDGSELSIEVYQGSGS